MIYSNIPNPPAKFTATMYGKTVTIEMDHSDIDLTELMEIFKGLAIASGFANDSWDSVIKELSAEIHDNEREDLKEKLNEWKNEDDDVYTDLRHNTPKDGLDEWKAKNGFGSWTADSEGHEDYKGGFKEFGDEDDEVIEDEDEMNKRMDIIGQNGNEGTHYQYDWDDNIKGYDYESNDILHNINDSITLIKDRMEDIDMRMDNIDEQLGILNADVANIEFNIQHPIKEALLNAKEVYDKSVIETERFNKVRKDIVDMQTGEVSVDGGFDGKGLFEPYKRKPNQPVTPKKMNKDVVKKGKIKDLKK